jgi:hypothetical protein
VLSSVVLLAGAGGAPADFFFRLFETVAPPDGDGGISGLSGFVS